MRLRGAPCDVTPPTVVLAAPASVWPPNHRYVSFSIADMVEAGTDPEAGPISVDSVRVARVSSDEPEDAEGDGATALDIVIAPDRRSVQLRRERQGGGNGRVYTVELAVSDPAGNEGTAAYTVSVPVSRSGGAVDDGPAGGHTVEAGASARTAPAAARAVPPALSVRQYPTPSSGAVTFELVSDGGQVQIDVYDVTGRSIRTVRLRDVPAGVHHEALDLSALAPGVYVYTVTTDRGRLSGRMVIAR